MFEDRIDAGTQLVQKLLKYKDENIVVLAIPRGGLPLGALVAQALKSPLDVVLTKKIGHPNHKEYAIGAVSFEDMILTDAVGVSQDYIEEEVARIRKKLRHQHVQYYKHRTPEVLKDKTVIIIDDGIATGNTLLATVKLVNKQRPKKIVVAVPVAPNSALRKFKSDPNIDEVICLLVPHNFRAVGEFYRKFDQVSDQEAISLFKESKHRKTTK